jgi:arginine:ornithine antiporter/lysine permease
MPDNKDKKLGLFLMIGLGIGSMIGAGIFNSPTDLISIANPQATMIAWIIGGFGVFMLALVFQMLSYKRPDLDGGIYSYAKVGFGEFAGFNSAWGYWLGAFLGNVAFIVIIFKTINSLAGRQLNSILVFFLGSMLLWGYHYMISRGIKNASIINSIITISKILPLLLVILFGIFAFKANIFSVPDWTTKLASAAKAKDAATSLKSQISGAMATIVWCFSGIEAAVVMSKRADNKKTVGRATIISFFVTLALYMFISIIAMGVIPAKELAGADTPLADVLSKTALGSAGVIIVKIGLLISVLGVFISWILLAAEIPYIAAIDGVMPKWFKKENKNGVPINSLLFTDIATQIFLFFLLVPQLQKAYTMTYTLATITIMLPYLFSALYAIKVCHEEKSGAGQMIVAVLATVYSIYVIYAIGIKYLFLAIILYLVGVIPAYIAKKEKGMKFSKSETAALLIMAVITLVLIIMLSTGKITL